jgi:endoglucanase
MSRYGFPGGPIYRGSAEDKAKLRRGFERKTSYSGATKSPLWNGEFGIVYATEETEGPEWKRINDERYECLREQLRIYAEQKSSWTIWLYKDIGVQGMVHVTGDSAWSKVFGTSIAKKTKHALDFWGTDA